MIAKNLVIVESPTKAKTIEKFLGADYIIKSSVGHICDMPKKNMGIDLKNNFKPTYVISVDKKKIVATLKKSIKVAKKVYLATDDDREGESIAWHLLNFLGLPANTPRIVFHEITKNAIVNAIASPRAINYSLVNSQQARRVIDRLVGFEISPVLWRKVAGARSAGRVQSPVVRLVVEREKDIANHVASSTFKVKAIATNSNFDKIDISLHKELLNKSEASKFVNDLLKQKLIVAKVEEKPATRSPKPPFITSTLQQEASQKLDFSVKQTMILAQNLYREGLITYMRTDSFALSEHTIKIASSVIKQKYGNEFCKIRHYKTKNSSAQEAHQAITPTDLKKATINGFDNNITRLYELIYKRTLASQMSDAKIQKTQIKINITNRSEYFIAGGEVLTFAGFLKVYNYSSTADKILPKVVNKEILTLIDLTARESFTRAKPHYTEASLVKKIEEMGIGRPSTFATIVSTVQDRGYVSKKSKEGQKRQCDLIEIKNNKVINSIVTEVVGKDKNKLYPTSIAYLLTSFLIDNFSNIIDYKFTSNLENAFDKIANEDILWQTVVKDFYDPFHKQIETAKGADSVNGMRNLGVDPKSGRQVSVRLGYYGPLVQIGVKEDVDKPIFASLKKEQNVESIVLDEALKLFDMPRIVGKTDKNQVISANYGRFGPYIKYGEKYISLKEELPENITLQKALELIANKGVADAKNIIKTFADSDIKVLNGRFGPYIWNGKRGKGQKNITVKKLFGDINPKNLSFEDCKQAIAGKLAVKKNESMGRG